MRWKFRSLLFVAFVFGAAPVVFSACGDDDDTEDATDPEGSGSGGGTDNDNTNNDNTNGGGDNSNQNNDNTNSVNDNGNNSNDNSNDNSAETDAVEASDQTLSDLSTVVRVDRILAAADGWVVVYDEVGGDLGELVGVIEVQSGETTDLEVVLERPAADGETLFARLHVDSPADGVFTFDGANGEDEAVLDSSSEMIAPGFTVTVPADTPAVRFVTDNVGASAYDWLSVEPAAFSSAIGPGANNEDISLNPGWRYEVVNEGFPAHPLDLVTLGSSRPMDTLLLTQDSASDGTLAGNSDIDFVIDGDTIRFTVTPTLEAEMTGYRCFIPGHVNMRGSFVYLDQ